MRFADLLCEHWPEYVARAGGAAQVPYAHWRAVEAVLSCRTPRLGGHVYTCVDCNREHFAYHSCNHRACPRCGAREQQLWSARQQARRLPVPYFMLTFTVPESLRWFFLRYDRVAYSALFAAVSAAIKELFADPKHFGGQPGFTAVLHTWTRKMEFHPHLHVLVPAVALGAQGCEVIRAKDPEFLLPHALLARRYREHFLAGLRDKHPGLYAQIDPCVGSIDWNVNIKAVGRGKRALRYLAAYVNRSAFSEQRLAGYDEKGRIRLWWQDSKDGKRKLMTLEVIEFIRRWLLHVLPKGLTRVRHYGFLGGAAGRAYRRLRFLLGGKPFTVEMPEDKPPSCPCCGREMLLLGKLFPVRGPLLSAAQSHNQ